MAVKQLFLLVGLMTIALASSEAAQLNLLSNAKAMEQAFLRSDETHAQSMAAIMSSMSSTRAMEVLEHSKSSTSELLQVANMALGKQSALRKQPKGYSGIDGARKLLNDMIYESMSKYDAEIAKCTDYYSRQETILKRGWASHM